MTPHERLAQLLARRPVILAPMEDVTDAVFRRVCRELGAEICVTEFVNAEGLVRGARVAQRKVTLYDGDDPTAIQIYGSDPERLAEAARIAETARPAFIDVNCGCWVPKVAQRGAGAGWLRDPAAMVAMAARLVRSVSLPLTVKTRIGWGPETEMPIVDLARRLEDAGVAALTIHCRVAKVGHSGPADWQWARRAREAVSIPVIVNGDVDSAPAALRALDETGCAGAMVGRAAIDHPWIFREARALLDRGERLPGPTPAERFALCKKHLMANVEQRGEHYGVQVTRRHLAGYLKGLPRAGEMRRALFRIPTLSGCLAYLAECEVVMLKEDAASEAPMPSPAGPPTG
jgi:nifR3 family TIM-barrel protein